MWKSRSNPRSKKWEVIDIYVIQSIYRHLRFCFNWSNLYMFSCVGFSRYIIKGKNTQRSKLLRQTLKNKQTNKPPCPNPEWTPSHQPHYLPPEKAWGKTGEYCCVLNEYQHQGTPHQEHSVLSHLNNTVVNSDVSDDCPCFGITWQRSWSLSQPALNPFTDQK